MKAKIKFKILSLLVLTVLLSVSASVVSQPVYNVNAKMAIGENYIIGFASNSSWEDLYADENLTLHTVLSGEHGKIGYLNITLNLTHAELKLHKEINQVYISGNITDELIMKNITIKNDVFEVAVWKTFSNETGNYTYQAFENKVFKVCVVYLLYHHSANELALGFFPMNAVDNTTSTPTENSTTATGTTASEISALFSIRDMGLVFAVVILVAVIVIYKRSHGK